MIEGLPCFQMKQRKDIADLHIEGELFSLVIGKNPLAVLPGQVVHAGRVLLGKCQFKERAGGFGGEALFLRHDDPGPDFGFCQRCHSGLHGYLRDWVSRSWYHKAQRYVTSGAIQVSQVPESGWPFPLPAPIRCNLSTNRKRKWRRCVAASIAVGPSAILTGSRTRPSDWGWNGRFGPVEDRRNNHRLITVTWIIWILQIWRLSPSPSPGLTPRAPTPRAPSGMSVCNGW